MRVRVTGAGGFVGAHLGAELGRAGHVLFEAEAAGADVLVALSLEGLRASLDAAALERARVVVLLSALGADAASPRASLAARGRAEEVVRAAGLAWVVLRPEIIWGPGDVFTNELAHLLRHLPFVPVPRDGPSLAPVHAGDVARAVVELLERPALWRRTWELPGPERLPYPEVVARVAGAIGLGQRRHLRVPAWSVRFGAALEERAAHRPRVTRRLLDRLVAGAGAQVHLEAGMPLPKRLMTVEALREYLAPPRAPGEQLAPV